MERASREEYLSRKVIETTFDISEEHILIYNNSTEYLNIRKCKPLPTEKDLTYLLNSIYIVAKKKGARVYGYNLAKEKCGKLLRKTKRSLVEESIQFTNLLDVVRIIERDKLHYGTYDDEELIKMYRITAKLKLVQKPIKDVLGYHSQLESLLKDLENFNGRLKRITIERR